MTTTTGLTASDTPAGEAGQPQEPGGPSDATPQEQAAVAIELLTAHPGNVRRDVSLDREFLDSVSELGILTPLRVTPDGAGGYRVIEGHRRLAAAEKLGLTEVPCDLAAGREGDEAGQFLDMYALNHHREALTALEEADALFAASASGATRTRIRKATGLGKDDVASALRAGRMTGHARQAAAASGQAITLEQLALLAEFDDDAEAVSRLVNAFRIGHNGQHVAEAIRQERTEAAAREQRTAQLTAAGYAVTTEYPGTRLLLISLDHDGQELTPEAHAACPGRAAYLSTYSRNVTHFCTDPEANGHSYRRQGSPLPDLSGGTNGAGTSSPKPGPVPDPARRLVIEGNRAWAAAGAVRRRWLAGSLLARRTAPREAMPFIAGQLMAMPAPLRDALSFAATSSTFREVTGGTIKPAETAGWPAARLPVAILAVIAAAHGP